MEDERLVKEYNLFGPWATLIESVDDLPRLFRDRFCFDDHLEFALKIPRDIERRNARPGMNLYDMVVSLYDRYLIVMRRDGERVECSDILYERILFIENIQVLLKGEIKIYTSDGTVIINYNTVSEPLISELIRRLRKKYVKEGAGVRFSFAEDNEPVNLPLFKNILYKAKQEDKMYLIGYQPSGRAEKNKKSVLDVIFGFKRVLQDHMYLTNNKELIVIGRTKEVKQARKADYGFFTAYLPLDQIGSVELKNDGIYSDVTNVKFHIGTNYFSFTADSKTRTAGWLEQIAGSLVKF